MKKALLSLWLFFPSLVFAFPSVDVVQLKAQPTLVVKGAVKKPQEVGAKLEEIFTTLYLHLEKKGIEPVSAPFARYLAHTSDQIVFEAGFAVAQKESGEGDIVASELPGGMTAKLIHLGAYENVAESYKVLHAWMEKNGKTPNGVPWEVYVDDPTEVKPQDLKTEVYYPIKQR